MKIPTNPMLVSRKTSLRSSILAGSIVALLSTHSGQAASYTWTKNSAATQTWTTVGNWSGSIADTGPGTNTDVLTFFADTTTALANGGNVITTSVPNLTMNVLTLNGKGAAATGASNITIGTSATTWTLDGTTPTVNLNGVNGTQALNYTVAVNLALAQANTLFTGAGTASFNFSGAISGVGSGLTKAGSSALTLSGTNTYTGGTFLNGGTLSFGADSNLGDAAGGVTITNNANLNYTGATQLSPSRIFTFGTGGGTITNANKIYLNGQNNQLTGSGTFTKAGAGILQLGRPNDLSGNWNINGGFVEVQNATALGSGSSTITLNAGELGTAHNVTNPLIMGNTAAIISAEANATYSGTILANTNFTVKTFFSPASQVNSTVTLSNVISGVGGITVTSSTTAPLGTVNVTNASNSYAGTTTVEGAKLVFGADQSLAASTNALTFGSTAGSTNPGTLDLTNASATFGGAMLVQTNTTSANSIIIGEGKTLTTNGNVTVGANTALNTNTKLTVSGNVAGNGTWTINNTAASGTFQVGAATGGTNTNSASVDLSGLGAFTANLSGASSVFRIGDSNTTSSATPVSSVTLAATSKIVANTLGVGDAAGEGTTMLLNLGSGVNTIWANNLTLGVTGASSARSSGKISFAGSTGSVVIRGQDGTSAASLKIGSTASTTGTLLNSSMDLSGHSADALFSTADIGNMSGAAAGNYAASMTFDTGTLGITTLKLGTKSSSVAFTQTGTLTLGNATTNAANTVTIGSIAMAAHSSTGGTAAGNLTIQGSNTAVSVTGALTVASDSAATGGTATGVVTINGGTTTATGGITLASRTSAGTLNGSLLLNGGSLTLGAGIGTSGTGGTLNTTLTVAGGTLDMGGFNIGSASAPVGTGTGAINWQAGTLKNIGSINGTAGITKTTPGLLLLATANTFSGTTVISDGTLQLGHNLALQNSVFDTSSPGTLVLSSGVDTPTFGGLTSATNLTLPANVTALTLNPGAGVTATYSGVLESVTAAIPLTKTGAGTQVLSGTNTRTGTTTISAGTLSVGADENLGNANALIFDGGTLQVTGTTLASYGSGMIGTHAVTLTAGKTVGFDINDAGHTFTVSQALNQTTGGLTKLGAGTLILSGANDFTGTTTINAGTLQLSGGNDRLLSTGTVKFDGATGSTATLDVGSTSQTLSTLQVSTASGIAQTININGTAGTLTLNGNSALSLGPTFSSGTQSTTVNMAGLGTFVYNSPSNNFAVQIFGSPTQGPTTQVSTVTLATGSNTITAANFNLGNNAGTSGGGASTVNLGTTNILNVGNINIGYAARSTATLKFNSGLTNPTLTVRNTDGISALTSWNVGKNIDNGPRTWTDTVDLVTNPGTLDAVVTTINVGIGEASNANRQGTVNGSFSVGATTGQNLTVTNLNLGSLSGASSTTGTFAVTGTFTLNSASGIVNATTITLASNTITTTGGTRNVTGTFNLTDGTLNTTTVQKGVQTGTATNANAAFNWTAGTVGNLAGSNLTWNSVPITLLAAGTHTFNISGSNTAALNSTSPISGTGFGITKTGTGTLSLSAANTYTGGTTVSNGMLSYQTTVAKPATGTTTVEAAGSLGLGLGGASSFSSDDVDSLFSNTLVNVSMDAASGVGIDTSAGDFTYATNQSAARSLTKLGANTLTLTGANTYTGPTVVAAGTLDVPIGGSISGSMAVIVGNGTDAATLIANGSIGAVSAATTVKNNAFLSGSGTVNGSLTAQAGGTVAPGNSPGILTVSNGFSLESGAHLKLELNGTTAGAGYDQVAVTAGNITLGGDLEGSTVGFTPTENDLFYVILNNGSGTTTGTLGGIAEGGSLFIGGQEFRISYQADSLLTTAGTFGTAAGNDVALLAVPEPSAAVSLLGGLGLLLGLRRRRA